jgi:hypothetical protein
MSEETKTRKKSYKQGQSFVKAGIMTQEQLDAGVKKGIFSPPLNSRDYGEDQNLYAQLQKMVDQANGQSKTYTFSITGRKV